MSDPAYVAARHGLLDALVSLVDHRDSIIVVGAQAVYLRVAGSFPGVSPYTTDGDVAVDSRSLAAAPPIDELMKVRFERAKTQSGDAAGPGHWVQTVTLDGKDFEVPLDLMVPDGIAGPAGRRGARLGPHGNDAARKVPGLEAALVDNDWLSIADLSESSDRVVEAKVAGPTALLIAKAHKIHDRLEQRAQRGRLVDKDASDVYLLMRNFGPGEPKAVLRRLAKDPVSSAAATAGMEHLVRQFGTRRGDGVEMAIRALGAGQREEERIRSVCTAFVRELLG
ncbi:MAG: hypothetical protein R2754_01825 [Microthrixaceae bacterium]